MDASRIIITAAVGLFATLVTALVTHVLTRRQEQRKHERDVAAKLSELKSTESQVTQIMATQYAHACLILDHPENTERDRIFLPVGCRITMGRGKENHIVINDLVLSSMHAAFLAKGNLTYVEPLAPTNGLTLNGVGIDGPRKLSNGDVLSVENAHFKITFVSLQK